MLHPLFHLIATQPQLLAEHASAYAELAAVEIGSASAAWQRRALLKVLALCCGLIALVLAGVALMLWGTLPLAQMPAPWVLWATPGALALLALGCWLAGLASPAPGGNFIGLRRQWQADLSLLRDASAP